MSHGLGMINAWSRSWSERKSFPFSAWVAIDGSPAGSVDEATILAKSAPLSKSVPAHLIWRVKFPMVSLQDIQQARSRLYKVAVRTPLVLCKLPEDRQIFVKPENLQPIGSFKLRGAYNKISSLTPEERARVVFAHSSV